MSTKKQSDPFAVRLWLTLAVLSLFCVVFAVLSLSQGPRIRNSTFNPAAATTQAGQRLVLHTNQPLATMLEKDITVKPATPIQVSAGGNTVIVQFTERLKYSTTYNLSFHAGKDTLSYSFATPGVSLYYLQRDAKGATDTIYNRPLTSAKAEGIYSNKDIVDFVVLAESIVVATRNENYTNELVSVDLRTGKQKRIELPSPGTVMHMSSSTDRSSFGFTFTAQKYDVKYSNNIFVVHANDLRLKQVKGFGGKPLQAIDWKFSPDTAVIAARLADSTVVLADTRSGSLTPLGEYTAVSGFNYDGSQLMLVDRDGPVMLDIKTLTQKNQLPKPALGKDSFATNSLPFQSSDKYLIRGQVFEGTYYAEYVAVSGRKDVLHQTGRSQGIISMLLSPNDDYVSLVVNEPVNGVVKSEARIINIARRDITTIDNASIVRW